MSVSTEIKYFCSGMCTPVVVALSNLQHQMCQLSEGGTVLADATFSVRGPENATNEIINEIEYMSLSDIVRDV